MRLITPITLLGLALCATVLAQDQPKKDRQIPEHPEVIRPSTSCEGITGALPEAMAECEKRETGRLFIILGKPEAALRILCNTRPAIEAYRPFGDDRGTNNAAANTRCLQEVGLGNK